ncbi:MAG: hypothetical protein KTR21_10055 [Rhodobacteraceae bacterium]|nr:hypothetical protein [Paracoccaceae bacterium]
MGRARAGLKLARWLGLALAVHKERRALRRLTETQRRDIGIDWRDADREARRPFWDVPPPRW